MKSNELMIGDWVLHHNNGCIDAMNDTAPYDEEIRIEQDDFELDEYFWGRLDPIPITPEILEKNGFKYNPDGYGYPTPVKFYDFPLGKGFFIEECEDGHYQITDHCFIHFRYVHDLQHALRLAGVEKEITI